MSAEVKTQRPRFPVRQASAVLGRRGQLGEVVPVGTYSNAWAEVSLALARAGLVPWTSGQRLVAYVNHGRWVADCECRNGIALDRSWPCALCPACGAVTPAAQITYPDVDELLKIEALLEVRLPQHQNWVPGESVAKLRSDNRRHGDGPMEA